MSRGGSPGFERIHVGGVWGSTQTPTDIIYWSAKVTLIGVGFSQPLTPVVGGGGNTKIVPIIPFPRCNLQYPEERRDPLSGQTGQSRHP